MKLTKTCKDCNDFPICLYDGSTKDGDTPGCDLWKPPFGIYQDMTDEEREETDKL